MRHVFPALFSTIAVPKSDELVALAYRHRSRMDAERFFLDGMTRTLQLLAHSTNPTIPVTIYYGFKQQESRHGSTVSTGWETFLDAIIGAGFSIHGTWPMRTELENRILSQGTNALASSVVLVCLPRASDAATIDLRAFIVALKREIPPAVRCLRRGGIAPVDLAQAVIGPGMAVYSRYAKVLDATGRRVTVRHALAQINHTLDELLAELEGDFDSDSRWAVAWFEQHGFSEGEYGVAEILSKAKNTSLHGLIEAGILESRSGKVRLLKPEEFSDSWNPEKAVGITVWECVHRLIRVLAIDGEDAAGELLFRLKMYADTCRELCYRLYVICENRKWFKDANSYNTLVKSWPEIGIRARETSERQAEMF